MLGSVFAEARRENQTPSDALMARIMADAAAELPRRAGVAGDPSAAGRTGIASTIWALLGGWAGAGGLAAATVAGLWIGVAPPAGLTDLAAGVLGETITVALVPDDDLLGVDG
ncbi:hypothetical protein ROA7023_00944 [Roseisalinus antarcticus]|uniref:Dihydroorotate dehydrogenase n=2 Tax=Roseisalinus antarcticus TaxID=254357 RepID=A0A1Y5S2K8_9RHOB|nr:hypothetical protein ROA7023_00944 [Roseisalinus antarcticus]